jgi:branched-chain amino acid transport system ATP-binding protein
MSVILELQNVSKSFSALLAVDSLSIRLNEGEALGILGPNGAGKTTLLNLISGDYPVSSGHILFKGTEITQISASQRCHLGVGRTYQIPRPFAGMTVFENVLVGATFGGKHHQGDVAELCRDVLALTGLLDHWNMLAGSLPLLERKRLELARALATQPTLLLLDEIAGGLTEHEVHELLAVIAQIRARKVTIIWIEHIVHALVSAVDRIMAMNFGNKLAEGSPQEVLANRDFQETYLGVETIQLEDRN